MSKESKKFRVPDQLANLYDFANSLDVRHFTHHGVQHVQSDELDRPAGTRGVDGAARLVVHRQQDHGCDVRYRAAATHRRSRLSGLRSRVSARRNKEAVRSLNAAMRLFPLVVKAATDRGMELRRLPRRRAVRTVCRSLPSSMTVPSRERSID